MSLINALLQALGAGLRIWETKLENKYYEEWHGLMTSLKYEEDRAEDARDQAAIDNIHYKLFLLAKKFESEAGKHEQK